MTYQQGGVDWPAALVMILFICLLIFVGKYRGYSLFVGKISTLRAKLRNRQR